MGLSVTEKSSESSAAAAETSSENPEEFQWTVDNEVHLFHAMIGNKPAGINKHFHMAVVCEKFSSFINKEVSSDCIWKFLDDLYNFDVLDDIEGVPFPNDEKDFTLPENEYGTLIKQKIKEIANIKVEEAEDRSASPRTQSTSRSTSRGAASKENAGKATPKKEIEKHTKGHNKDSTSNSAQNSTDSSNTPNKASEKESTKLDPRRDSKDSTSSNKEALKTPASVTKASAKEKMTKSSRSSVAEKLDESLKSDDSASAKRGNKRSTRGSMKSEEPTPPSRRRRI